MHRRMLITMAWSSQLFVPMHGRNRFEMELMSRSRCSPRQAACIQRSFARPFGWHSFRRMLHRRFWQAASRRPSRWPKSQSSFRCLGRSIAACLADVRGSDVMERAVQLIRFVKFPYPAARFWTKPIASLQQDRLLRTLRRFMQSRERLATGLSGAVPARTQVSVHRPWCKGETNTGRACIGARKFIGCVPLGIRTSTAPQRL
jgi:hypothetical protein